MRRRCWLVLLLLLAACSNAVPTPIPPTSTRADEPRRAAQGATQGPGSPTPTVPAPTSTRPPAAATATRTPTSPPPAANRATASPTAARLATAPGAATAARPIATPGAPAPAGTAQVVAIPLGASDLVYDPRGKLLYAALPDQAGSSGGRIVAIDPFTGTVDKQIPVGGEPARLALSDDGQVLYAGMRDTGEVWRYRIADQRAERAFSLGRNGPNGTLLPGALAVVPGQPGTVVVARYDSQGWAGLVAYAEGTRLPGEIADRKPYNPLAFCGPDHTLYTGLAGGTFVVGDAGVAAGEGREISINETVFGSPSALRCEGDRLYTGIGDVYDTRQRRIVGAFPDLKRRAIVCPDESRDRVFFLDVKWDSPTLQVFDRADATLLAELTIPDVEADDWDTSHGGQLLRWGDDGLAFLSDNHLHLVRSPIIGGQRPATIPLIATLPAPQLGTAQFAPTPSPAPSQAAVHALPLGLNDYLLNPANGLVYGSSSGTGGNVVVVVDPRTEAVVARIPVAGEPDRLAIADDGSLLYVGLKALGAIQRIDTRTRQAERPFVLGTDQQGSASYAVEIAVMPGQPRTVAIAKQSRGSFGIALYTDGVPHPQEVAGLPQRSGATPGRLTGMVFCGSPDRLFALGPLSALYRFRVDASGIGLIDTVESKLSGSVGVCAAGLIYYRSGEVFDPLTGTRMGAYPVHSPGAILAVPDEARVLLLIEDSEGEPILALFDRRRYGRLGTVALAGLDLSSPRSFLILRWAPDAVAILDEQGAIQIVRSPLLGETP